MKRLFYNCEKLELSYNSDIDFTYSKHDSPIDGNSYLKIKEAKKRDKGSLLHVLMDGEDKGLFIVDENNRLVSITSGEQFYRPLYKAYDDLIDDIGKIG